MVVPDGEDARKIYKVIALFEFTTSEKRKQDAKPNNHNPHTNAQSLSFHKLKALP